MATKQTEGQETQAPMPTTYSVAELIANAHVFGQSKAVVAGALYGKDNLTKDEAIKLIEAFTKKVVGKGGGK